jgi:hypothetical protein
MPENPGGTSAEAGTDTEQTVRLESLASREAYEAFLSAARAVEAGSLQECHANIVLAYDSVTRGVEDVLGHEAELGQLPDVKVEELRSLPRLVQGLAHTVVQRQHSLRTGGRATDGTPLPLAEATELRDRFWTLLLQRHEALWRCGAWIHGHTVDEHVPPLQAGRGWEATVEAQRSPSPPPGQFTPPRRPNRRRERVVIRIGPELSRL